MSPILSSAIRFEFIIEKIVNGTCIVALRTGSKNDVSCERKIRALFEQLDDQLLNMGGITSLRQFISTLENISEAQKSAGRSFHREIQQFVAKLGR
ncbi:unnamed protein product [Caenorhabditis angaria]|uniref:Uncharacterized protein n=1 Tax=Caenorhabditis angaria TaxID=860376 RepID=A0A9P1I4V6_9PELO|nr:unnamed protein product [Caenorhabditis angaria]